jgi:ornithine cyclodeaminase/alanine dehydrogenase-like protein (mu-crystallin family)
VSDRILYLGRRDVEAACRDVDPVAAVREALALHARGETILPAEAYLAWTTGRGEHARSLAMPGALEGDGGVVGTKLINANADNVERGLPRASGLTVLFDPETAQPLAVLEAARISALRTAAVTALAAELLGARPLRRLALLGAGEIAATHLELLAERLPKLAEVRVHDIRPERADALARRSPGVTAADTAEAAVRGADLVVAATTATESYLPLSWLAPGSLLMNVSLDDPLPEVFCDADLLVVDDWELVAADEHRILGRLARARRVTAPGTTREGARPVDAELGEIVTGAHPGRRRKRDVVVVNPFGLAIEDLALAARVHEAALERGPGVWLDR